MKKYLIIGGAGFIGSHLCEALLALGNSVVVIDDFSTSALKKISPQITSYKISIDNAKKIQAIFKKEKPDVVYHLAGAIHLRRVAHDPLFVKSLNVLGRTQIILDACHQVGVKKLIFISSGGAIYENATKVPTGEPYLAHPTSLYGLANLLTEKYIEQFSKSQNLLYVILRLSNVYGPRQWETGVVPSLIKNLLQNKRPVINGDGQQTRDFIYIEDVIDACIVAAKNLQGMYNVGSGKEASLNQVFELVKNITGSLGVEPVYQTSKTEESKRSALDITKIKQEVSWESKISLEEGLKKTVEWFRNKN